MLHRASMMQVMLVMIHTLDPDLHRSTISWMWDPALVINGLVVSTPPQEDVHTVTFMTAALHHTQCVVHAAGMYAPHVLHSMRARTTELPCPRAHPVDGHWTLSRLAHTLHILGCESLALSLFMIQLISCTT